MHLHPSPCISMHPLPPITEDLILPAASDMVREVLKLSPADKLKTNFVYFSVTIFVSSVFSLWLKAAPLGIEDRFVRFENDWILLLFTLCKTVH